MAAFVVFSAFLRDYPDDKLLAGRITPPAPLT
jgi:hypothetical protein